MYDYDEIEQKRCAAMEEVWTLQMLAERWKVKPRLIREMLAAGEIKGFKVRMEWRIYFSEILRYEGEDPKAQEHQRPQAVAPMPKPVVIRITP